MTRFKHIFRHLSSAAKKSVYNKEEWKIFHLANSSEKAAAKAEIAQKIRIVEKKLSLLKKDCREKTRLIQLEDRLVRLKGLIGKD